MTAPRVVGLDLSLCSTGIAIAAHDSVTTHRIKPRMNGHERLAFIVDSVRSHTAGAQLVVMEGPAYGVKGGKAHEMAGIWWIVRHQLWADDLPVAVASPSNVKQYATGSGNADKDRVLAAAIRRFPDVDVQGNDEADGLWLAAAGRRWLGHPIDTVPQANHAALNKIEWPDIDPAELAPA